MRSQTAALGFAMLGLLAAESAAQQPETVAAFDHYIQVTDARVADEVRNADRFLWIDTLSQGRRAALQAALRRGEVVVERIERNEGGGSIEVPGGLLHHWVGTVFAPGASVGEAVGLLQDYDRHGEIFAPVITQSRVLTHRDDDFTFTMRFVIRKVISAVLNTEQQAHFERPSADRAFSRIVSTRITEVEDAGTPSEREKPADRNRGYLWRLVSYWRFLQRDGGTYIQCESVSLSRPLPAGFGWLLGRAASGVPRDITSANLAATRRALLKR